MPESDAAPSPAAALEAVFRGIQQRQMQDMPMLNLALRVEAVGFRPWNGHWLGILITPWFMNLWLMPRLRSSWEPLPERESRHHVFPAGVFEFIGGHDPVLGDYQACSLFSPMFEFGDAQAARDTAIAALDALFDPECRDGADVETAGAQIAAATAVRAPAAPAQAVSKRGFLFGRQAGGEREPRG
jgi:[NiFe] hydrogenase assembly HybE family chaperone